ncbi:MAG: HPr family phosphocarrier protein [Gemmataceae bacterium]
MNGTKCQRRTVVVANPHGLHMRPATAFATFARKFASKVQIFNGSNKADGKSSLDLILLVALPGAELIIEVDGPDADQAIDPLAEMLGSSGDGL